MEIAVDIFVKWLIGADIIVVLMAPWPESDDVKQDPTQGPFGL